MILAVSDQFKKMLLGFGKTEKGSECWQDYVPGIGALLTVNVVITDATITGDDLFMLGWG